MRLIAAVLGLAQVAGLASAASTLTFRGASDASAAVALNADLFVVADDETNQLRIYRSAEPGLPVAHLDLSRFAVVDSEHPELDLEGATRVGDRIYWIGSHGRNKDGKLRPNRRCFFATDIKPGSDPPGLEPVGRVYRNLIDDLLRIPGMRSLKLAEAVRLPLRAKATRKERKKLAPKRRGLNIEALCADAMGKTLYIGLRNPRPLDAADNRPKALLIPMTNAEAVLLRAERPQFGKPFLLDLQGMGLRSMNYVPALERYILVAGSHSKAATFVVYDWSGRRADAPRAIRTRASPKYDFRPEALLAFPAQRRLLLLSDDGSRLVDPYGTGRKVRNKTLKDLNRRTFRGLWLEPDF